MEEKRHNSPADADADVTLTAPRFNSEAEAEARPVEPLGRVAAPADSARPPYRPRMTTRARRVTWRRYLLLAWAIVATLAAGGIALYRNTRTTPASTQSSVEETTDQESESTPTRPARADVAGTGTKPARETEARRELPRRAESDIEAGKESERRERDEEKRDEHARKEEEHRGHEEEKRAERERKEAEKRAERQRRDSEKRGEPKARLIGTITEKPER